MPIIVGLGGGSTQATVQFVDSIATTPVVRFDFNDLSPSMVTTINLSPPQMRRAKATTFLADGELVTANRHGNRQIPIEIEMLSASEDTAAAALSALGLELNRDNNILLVQIGSFVTFYRTYRSPEFVVEMLNYDTTLLKLTATLEAEPYGLGLPVQAVVVNTAVSSDPASGGRCFDVNGVIGDVEAPMLMTWNASFGWPASVTTILVGVRRRGTPSALPHVLQAETGALDLDTTVATSHDAAMSGTGNNYTTTSFATFATMGNRVGFYWPPASTVEARGAYRVIARVRHGLASAGQFQVQAQYGTASPVVLAPPVTTSGSSGARQLLDLGTVTIPAGTDPVSQGYSNVDMPVAPDFIWVQAARLSGTAALEIDYLYLIPADDLFTAVTWGPSMPTGSSAVLDSVSDAVYQVLDATLPLWTVTPSAHVFTGATPMLSPGNNRIYMVGPFNSSSESVTDSMAVGVTYWPRYLTVATA